jgi:hypothetical protein
MLLYTMLRRFGRPQTLAFSAALILATMASYWSNARGVGEDSLLTLGVTTALLAFYQAVRPDRQGSSVGAWALFTAGMVIATLSKGVLGHGDPGDAGFGGALQLMVAQGKEEQQTSKQEQQGSRTRHGVWLPGQEDRPGERSLQWASIRWRF